MKTEKWYDIGCDRCGKHMSTDFFIGFGESSVEAVRWAKKIGYKDVSGVTLCPYCVKELQNDTKVCGYTS